jgi:hypothetical protein
MLQSCIYFACASSVYEPRVDKLDKLGKYYNAINSTLVFPNVMTVIPFVLIVVPFAGRVVPLNRTTVVPFTIVVPFTGPVVPFNRTTVVPFMIVVPLQVFHLWRLGIENRR